MPTATQLIPEPQNSHTRGGPRTSEGKSASSKNATTHGLFANNDFIRPDEHGFYAELGESLRAELAPHGVLELNLAHEIRRTVWRLRRCGQVESNLVLRLNDNPVCILDPMETSNSSAERIQRSVDRARSQAHRLLHKCTAELRKLQTERVFRGEYLDSGPEAARLGIASISSVRKSIGAHAIQQRRGEILNGTAPIDTVLAPECPPPASSFCKTQSSFCKTPTNPEKAQPQTPRNAQCPCGSGMKHKRCCGKGAPAVLHAA